MKYPLTSTGLERWTVVGTISQAQVDHTIPLPHIMKRSDKSMIDLVGVGDLDDGKLDLESTKGVKAGVVG